MTRFRTRPRPSWALPLLLGLALTACGSGTSAAEDDATAQAGAGGGAAGTCLEGTVDCVDTPGLDVGEAVAPPTDGSVPVAEAVAAGIQGPFLMSGYLVVDAAGARLCEALAESFPPRCGGTSAALEPATAPAGVTTTTEGDVTWSDEPVLVEGELVDGVFVVRTA